jgi:hypothetical protein
MVETHSEDMVRAYPWFGFDHVHQVRDGVIEPQIEEEMTLGNLLDRYASACRKRQDAPEGPDREARITGES